jgi:hypothetical protein
MPSSPAVPAAVAAHVHSQFASRLCRHVAAVVVEADAEEAGAVDQ